MQLHHVVEYNMFEDVIETAKVCVLGSLLLGVAVVVIPPIVVGRLLWRCVVR